MIRYEAIVFVCADEEFVFFPGEDLSRQADFLRDSDKEGVLCLEDGSGFFCASKEMIGLSVFEDHFKDAVDSAPPPIDLHRGLVRRFFPSSLKVREDCSEVLLFVLQVLEQCFRIRGQEVLDAILDDIGSKALPYKLAYDLIQMHPSKP